MKEELSESQKLLLWRPKPDPNPEEVKVICGRCVCKHEIDPEKRALIEMDVKQVMCPLMGAKGTWINIPTHCSRFVPYKI